MNIILDPDWEISGQDIKTITENNQYRLSHLFFDPENKIVKFEYYGINELDTITINGVTLKCIIDEYGTISTQSSNLLPFIIFQILQKSMSGLTSSKIRQRKIRKGNRDQKHKQMYERKKDYLAELSKEFQDLQLNSYPTLPIHWTNSDYHTLTGKLTGTDIEVTVLQKKEIIGLPIYYHLTLKNTDLPTNGICDNDFGIVMDVRLQKYINRIMQVEGMYIGEAYKTYAPLMFDEDETVTDVIFTLTKEQFDLLYSKFRKK